MQNYNEINEYALKKFVKCHHFRTSQNKVYIYDCQQTCLYLGFTVPTPSTNYSTSYIKIGNNLKRQDWQMPQTASGNCSEYLTHSSASNSNVKEVSGKFSACFKGGTECKCREEVDRCVCTIYDPPPFQNLKTFSAGTYVFGM